MKTYKELGESLQARADKMRADRDAQMKQARDDVARKRTASDQRDNINKAKDEIKKELGIN